MSHTTLCTHCNDTGMLPGSDHLDCGHCGAAAERAALESAFPMAANEYPDMIWAIHQRARDIAYAEIVRLSKERNQAEARIVSSTDAFKRIAQAHHAALVATNGDAGEIAKLATYLTAGTQVVSEPVAQVDADDNGMWADILPNVTVNVGQKLYAAPLPASADKLREAILELMQNLPVHDEYQKGYNSALEDAAELAASMAVQAPVQQVPDDEWQLVPKVSTSKMDRAGEEAYESMGHCDCGNAHGTSMEYVYAAMLAAAPIAASMAAAPEQEKK